MYYCSDFRGNVVALLTADGKVAEQYRYSASGVPFGLPQGNVKSDGAVDAATSGTTDWTITDYIRVNTYEARADFDLDGDVDSADLAIVTANNGKVTGRGTLTAVVIGNRNACRQLESFGQGLHLLYSTPSRTYDAGLGRVLQDLKDPTDEHKKDRSCWMRGRGSLSEIAAATPSYADTSTPIVPLSNVAFDTPQAKFIGPMSEATSSPCPGDSLEIGRCRWYCANRYKERQLTEEELYDCMLKWCCSDFGRCLFRCRVKIDDLGRMLDCVSRCYGFPM